MLAAVLEDFAQADGVEVQTLVHRACREELDREWPGRVHAGDERAFFFELAGQADYTLVIAPEFDGLLERRCRWVLAAGGRLLNPSVAAVRLAGDKWRLGRHWRRRGIPTPPCERLSPARCDGVLPWPRVLKPRHGAGSQATFLVRDAGELEGAMARARAEMPGDELVVQPFIPGRAASVAFLIGPQGPFALLPASQEMSANGHFHYQGGCIPLPPSLTWRATLLGRRAVEAVPGLKGYVGVDLVLGEETDGRGDCMLEMNPRLTTSYVGLRALAETNLAAALLRVALGETLGELRWRRGRVRFAADGTCRLHTAL
jgi:predicted ATP-grasp superfamily ATP-dependent carboligase